MACCWKLGKALGGLVEMGWIGAFFVWMSFVADLDNASWDEHVVCYFVRVIDSSVL